MNSPADPERREGTFDEALANGRAMLRTHPEMALRQAQVILSRDGEELRALRLAAAAHRALGQAELAERAEMVAIERSGRNVTLARAAKARSAGDFGEASRLAAEQIRREPDDLAALTLSAETAIALGLPDKAEPLLNEVLARVPRFGHARYLLANALVLMDRQREAIPLIEQMLEGEPKDGNLLTMLAKAHSDLGDFDKAVAVGERLLALGINLGEAWTNQGDGLRFAGRKEEAIQAYRQAIRANPCFGRAWWSLTDIDAKAIGDNDIAAMERALEMRIDESDDAGNLHFALGMARDARGEVGDAFAQFAAGNALRRRAQPYDPAELTAQLDRYLAHLTPDRIPERQAPANSDTPIFIVGMPRSGSTLLERILGRHSRIEALGELSIVPHLIERLKLDGTPETLEARIAALGPADLARMGNRYLARAEERKKTGKPFVIDKLHMNWRHLALILRILPQAVVIDLRRAGMDCCWSNYKTLFSRGHPAASDLGDIGRFYRDYVRFTDELRARAPGRILFARYENLVDDLEGTVRPLLEAIGLPFEPDMLDFHLSREPVATASSEQVRRPLNRSGLGAWRPYEPWLGPLKDALGPLTAA